MADRYIEIRITNYTADKLVENDLDECFSERFIRGEKYTDVRFGPFNLHSEELKQLSNALDFLNGLPAVNVMVTRKPF